MRVLWLEMGMDGCSWGSPGRPCDAKDPVHDATMPLPEPCLPSEYPSSLLKTIGISQGIRLGIRAHDLGRFSADELARRVSSDGFECVQLALGKAIAEVDLNAEDMDERMVAGIAEAFIRHRVRIEVLGCYINPIHPDPATRDSLHGRFREHLRHAGAFGCGIVALESGSLHGDYSPHPGNHGEEPFQQLVRGLAGLVEEAEHCGVVVGIEAVTSHVVSTPEKMRRLLEKAGPEAAGTSLRFLEQFISSTTQ